jgi:carboxylesterase
MTDELLPGAEPWSVEGGPAGALCIHGFTGNPTSMRGVAEALAAAGFSVELPRLPGHGTNLDDMKSTSWSDWAGAVDAAYQRLAGRTDRVIVTGLSMGGTLTLWTALRHPEVVGLACVNPATRSQPPEIVDMLRGMVDEGQEEMPGIGSDIADPDAVESAYPGTPLRPLLSFLQDGIAPIEGRYGEITVPLLLLSSGQDHVVDPSNADFLAENYGGPVERVSLERSYHVATLDYDKDLIFESIVAFARKVTRPEQRT